MKKKVKTEDWEEAEKEEWKKYDEELLDGPERLEHSVSCRWSETRMRLLKDSVLFMEEGSFDSGGEGKGEAARGIGLVSA